MPWQERTMMTALGTSGWTVGDGRVVVVLLSIGEQEVGKEADDYEG